MRSFPRWAQSALSLFCGALASIAIADAQTTIAQKIAAPAYFYPTAPFSGTTYWETLGDSVPDVEFAVVNVVNGPDYAAQQVFADAIAAAHDAGVKVLGYVDTGYFGTTSPSPKSTRLKETTAAAWRAQIIDDIDAWFSFYGSDIDGIFFDQVQNSCGSSDAYVELYREVNAYVKQNHPGAVTVLNPGIAVPQCYEDAGDVLLVFEGSYDCYFDNAGCPSGLEYQTPGWDPIDPRKFWHLVYDTSSSNLSSVVSTSKSRKAGFVYVTDDSGANPWDTLPGSTYWSSLRSSVASGGAPDSTPPTDPESVDTVEEGWHDALLDWTPSTDSGSGVVGYDLYNYGVYMKSVPATPLVGGMKQAYVGGLESGEYYSIAAQARDGAGNKSGVSAPVYWETEPPDGVAPTAPGSLTIADEGYAFVKLSWSASTDQDQGDAIRAYDVYQDGAKVLTLPPTVLATPIVGLSPGTNYNYTVKARDSRGKTSSASSTAYATTDSLPGGVAIAPASVGAGGNQYTSTSITYAADFYLPFAFRRVYIDTDQNTSTGYLAGTFGNAVGGDYLIEGSSLHKYAGDGSSFVWTFVDTVTPTESGDELKWVVPLSAFSPAIPTSQSVMFQGNGFAPLTNSSLVQLTQE